MLSLQLFYDQFDQDDGGPDQRLDEGFSSVGWGLMSDFLWIVRSLTSNFKSCWLQVVSFGEKLTFNFESRLPNGFQWTAEDRQ